MRQRYPGDASSAAELCRCKFERRPGSAKVLNACRPGRQHADVAQLVAHHLAKVRVAGSNPVVRSEAPDLALAIGGSARLFGIAGCRERAPRAAEWPSGLGKGLQSPVHGFDSRLRLAGSRAVSSAGERFPDTEEVTGSNPVRPTSNYRRSSA